MSLSAFASPEIYPTKYDGDFRDAARMWLPSTDPLRLKAQCWQESRLDPSAVSPAGARGLCQFMPNTWRETPQQSKQIHDATASIHAAAWYMARLRKQWNANTRSEREHYSLALASYNAGTGNIIKAQRLCGDPNGYEQIMACLPKVTGPHNAAETQGYAPRIWRHYERMRLL